MNNQKLFDIFNFSNQGHHPLLVSEECDLLALQVLDGTLYAEFLDRMYCSLTSS